MKLGVNIDHVATLRQARLPKGQYVTGSSVYPDPVDAVRVCRKAGADSIVMHLREDRRHIQDRDMDRVRRMPSVRLNMEMSIAPSVMAVALKLRPHQATLVPERRQEQTTESGLNVLGNEIAIGRVIAQLKKRGIEVSLFVDPQAKQIAKSHELGAQAVELHTGTYANQKTAQGHRKELKRLVEAAEFARSLELISHAGHGLDYQNVKPIVKSGMFVELNIGYSIVSRAVWVGLDQAVREMKELVKHG